MIGPQQGVAAAEVAGPAAIGLFQVVAPDGVAQFAHGEEAALNDEVQEFLDDFLLGHAFRQVLRL